MVRPDKPTFFFKQTPVLSRIQKLCDSPLKSGRALSRREVEQLAAQGNRCENWSLLRVAASFDPNPIVGNTFSGANYLGITKMQPENKKPNGLSRNNHAGSAGFQSGKAFRPGIFFSNLSGCCVQNARLQNVLELKNYYIDAGASLKNIGSLHWEPGWNLGMGHAIHPGSETGERRLWLLEQASLEEYLWCLQLDPLEQKQEEKRILKACKAYASPLGYVGPAGLIAHVKELRNTWVDAGATIQSALKLHNVTLLNPANDRRTHAAGHATRSGAAAKSGKTEKGARGPSHEEVFIGAGVYLENCLVKEGARVDTGAIVKNSILMEHGEVEERAVVHQSLLGPGASIGKGEVTACFLGPFTTSHHQSLLIATLWPEGKGNVGHGSSLGSNHTGKKPDQEMSVGEGVFFGLDSRVKFPCNLSEAPYSLLAAGTSLLPQKISFPFSLILPGEESVARIIPGWMWGENPYALFRNMYKYREREKRVPAPHHSLFTRELAQLVVRAYESLKDLRPGETEWLDHSHCPGLGKTHMHAKDLDPAMEAYRDFLYIYQLEVKARGEKVPTSLQKKLMKILANPTEKTSPASQKTARLKTARLKLLRERLIRSIEKDDRRGALIFNDYPKFHPPIRKSVASDLILKKFQKEVNRWKK